MKAIEAAANELIELTPVLVIDDLIDCYRGQQECIGREVSIGLDE
jgi:hypothetical protein